MSAEELWTVLSLGILGGGATYLFLVHPFYVKQDRKIFVEIPERERKELQARFDQISDIGGLVRVYYDESTGVYCDSNGQRINTSARGQEVKNLTCAGYGLNFFDHILKEIEEEGKTKGADYFSFTSHSSVHGNFAFGVLYHGKS